VAEDRATAKTELLERMAAGFADLRRQAHALPDLRPSVDGTCHAFEVLSHICGWHRRTDDRLRRLARGEADIPPHDEDRINAGYVAQHATFSTAALLAALDDSFGDLQSAVQETPDGDFWRGGPGEEDSLAYFIVAANTYEHYEEHAADLASRQ
jgi:hypothetical protein